MTATTTTKPVTYILKLATFLVAVSFLGVIVLGLMFAPATNPDFLNGELYRGNDQTFVHNLARKARFLDDRYPCLPILDALSKPQPKDEFEKLGLTPPNTVKFKTADGEQLEGWYFPDENAKADGDTVLVSYDGFGKRLPLLAGYVRVLKDAGLAVFLFDYRGYNNERVKPNMHTACIDLQAAYDYLTKEKSVKPDHLVLLGHQLGSYACLKIANSNKAKALILEEPWTTVKAYVQEVPGAIAMAIVPDFLYSDDMLNNLHQVGAKHVPILVVSANSESQVTPDFYQAIPQPKSQLALEGYMPFELCPDMKTSGAKYTKAIKSFLSGEK